MKYLSDIMLESKVYTAPRTAHTHAHKHTHTHTRTHAHTHTPARAQVHLQLTNIINITTN